MDQSDLLRLSAKVSLVHWQGGWGDSLSEQLNVRRLMWQLGQACPAEPVEFTPCTSNDFSFGAIPHGGPGVTFDDFPFKVGKQKGVEVALFAPVDFEDRLCDPEFGKEGHVQGLQVGRTVEQGGFCC